MPRLSVRHAFVAVMLLVAMLCQETWALAGTTGGITGYVRDTDGAPVAAAKVTASSPSEVTSTTTDSTGHFEFLSLAPDTYTLGASKENYQDSSVTGITVFADQVQTASISMPKTLRTIASVRSQAGSLLKSGVGGDIYNVTPAQL
jgi:Carboxypeptidase regulatory-like domain